MKRSVLDMTQGILNTIDGDPVTSISDTNEAYQVALQIRQAYLSLIDEQQLPANHEMVTLEALSDTDSPHVLKLPERASRIIFFTYDVRESESAPLQYRDVAYSAPEKFIREINKRDSTNTSEHFIWSPPDQPALKLIIGNKAHPSFWTSFDDEHIVFDSFNSTVEASMQSSKTQAYCEIHPTFLVQDDFVPDLPDNLFTLLYSMAENRCFYNSRQKANQLGDRDERRMRTRAQRLKFRDAALQNKFDTYPDYGRKRPG